MRPLNGIAHADSRRLWAIPQFGIFRSIVILDAVSMVNRFIRQQVTAEHVLHNKDVFENVTTASAPRMIGEANHDVASLVLRSPSAPIAVQSTIRLPTREARCRLRLLFATAWALISGSARRATQVSTRGDESVTALRATAHRRTVADGDDTARPTDVWRDQQLAHAAAIDVLSAQAEPLKRRVDHFLQRL